MGYIIVKTDGVLIHHGVKGMKWGVRRYRNYDGSYVKRGLRDFDESINSYEQAYARYKVAKKGTNKLLINQTKHDMKRMRHQVKRDYKQLKRDKLADQGKYLYETGHTITGNGKTAKIAAGIAAAGVTGLSYLHNNGFGYRSIKVAGKRINGKTLAKGIAAATVAAEAVNAGISAKNSYQDRRLRAYYGHSRRKTNPKKR